MLTSHLLTSSQTAVDNGEVQLSQPSVTINASGSADIIEKRLLNALS